MNKVYIVGVGQIPVLESWDKSLKELAGDAALLALENAQPALDSTGSSQLAYPDMLVVGNLLAGVSNKQLQLGTLLADWLGFHNKPAVLIEAGDASGAQAFRVAAQAIASGEVDTALVIGAEKMTDVPSSELDATQAAVLDLDLESDLGTTLTSQNAMLMRRYMHEFNWTLEDFAAFTTIPYENAVNNPFARFQRAISKETYLKAPMLSEPINAFDAAASVDGAAAIVLSNRPITGQRNVRMIASSSASDKLGLENRIKSLSLPAVEHSSKQVYAQTGLIPSDLHLFEYHDAYTILAALSLEASGFAERGQAPQLANAGKLNLKGSIPVASMGGLKARGNPIGASGIYQIIESYHQLLGLSAKNQIENARFAMTQNISGTGSSVTTHIFTRE